MRRLHHGQKPLPWRHWLKWVVVADLDQQFLLSQSARRGPWDDCANLPTVVEAAARRTLVLADAEFDNERNHIYIRRQLGARSVIPAKRGKKNWRIHGVRAEMRRAFPQRLYRRRALIESVFSSVKRKLSARAPGRTLPMQVRQALLLGLSFNLYRLRHRSLFLRMSTELLRFTLWFVLTMCPIAAVHAQTLAPRAYVITPLHGNAIALSWSYFDGGLDFNGTIPITGASGTYSVPAISYYHSFGLLGRSANFTGLLPYGVGTFHGAVLGTRGQVYRSGLLDLTLRFSVNLKGGPAMTAPQFATWKQKTLLGVSLTVVAPTGQYNPTHLINWGINRWAFKPELGYSRRFGKWVLDGYGGVWFYTANGAFYSLPSPRPQTQSPIGSFESHLSYDFNKLHFWASLDGNFWFGGTTSLGGITNAVTRQTSSRIGGTFSFPLRKHQTIKVSYSDGAYVRFGGNYQSVSVAWQYSWIGKPN